MVTWPGLSVGQHYKLGMSAHCHRSVPILIWLRCCYDVQSPWQTGNKSAKSTHVTTNNNNSMTIPAWSHRLIESTSPIIWLQFRLVYTRDMKPRQMDSVCVEEQVLDRGVVAAAQFAKANLSVILCFCLFLRVTDSFVRIHYPSGLKPWCSSHVWWELFTQCFWWWSNMFIGFMDMWKVLTNYVACFTHSRLMKSSKEYGW